MPVLQSVVQAIAADPISSASPLIWALVVIPLLLGLGAFCYLILYRRHHPKDLVDSLRLALSRPFRDMHSNLSEWRKSKDKPMPLHIRRGPTSRYELHSAAAVAIAADGRRARTNAPPGLESMRSSNISGSFGEGSPISGEGASDTASNCSPIPAAQGNLLLPMNVLTPVLQHPDTAEADVDEQPSSMMYLSNYHEEQ